MTNVVKFPARPEPNDPQRDGKPRWHAVLTYRSELGPIYLKYDFEEMDELQGLVERGPDWRTMEECLITYNGTESPGLTIEESETL